MTIAINIRPHKPTIPIKTYHMTLMEKAESSLTNEKDKTALSNFLQGKPVKSPKRLRKAIGFVFVTALALWNQTAFAQEPTTVENVLPKEIDDMLFKIQLACLAICVGMAIVMAMVAGFFRIVGLREEAKKRYTDAIAGMTMVLTAPVVLGVIATIVRGFLKLFPNYGV